MTRALDQTAPTPRASTEHPIETGIEAFEADAAIEADAMIQADEVAMVGICYDEGLRHQEGRPLSQASADRIHHS